MIIEAIFNILFGLVNFVITLLPEFPSSISTYTWVEDVRSVLSPIIYFIGVDNWQLIISNIVIWLGIFSIWTIIEWVYKKIPGVD